MPIDKGSIYTVRRPWKGEQDTFDKLGADAFEEFKEIEKSTRRTNDRITALESVQVPELGITFIAEKLGTDDLLYSNIGQTQATATEIKGTGGSKFRVQVQTPADVKHVWIEFHDRFAMNNVSGSQESFVTAGQYGTGESPSTWINTEINVWVNISNNANMTHKETRYFGSGTALALAPSTIYTFRAVIWCTSGATADIKHLDGTAGSFRNLVSILHPF